MGEIIPLDSLKHKRRIGSTMFCETPNRTIIFKCIDVMYNEGLGKYVYIGITRFGNMARLSENEVHFERNMYI